MDDVLTLTQTLETIKDDTSGEKISVGDLVEALNSRGYGPLLIGPALIAILPTGAIPGVPAICALLIIFVSIQILIGRSRPWLPKKLKNFSFQREKFMDALDKAKPYTQKIDRLIHPRLTFLIKDEIKPVIAVICILLSLAIMIIGFVPFLAALPATAIVLLGLGLSGHDGLLMVLALIVAAASLLVFPSAWAGIFG